MENININFVEEIKKLRPVTWIYKEDKTNRRHIGYIAEEVNESENLKYCVSYDENNEPDGLFYDKFTVYLTEALKTALNKIDELENRVSKLEEK
jgi:hypothetical protein